LELNLTEVQEAEKRLQEESARSRTLETRMHELEANARAANERIQRMTARESDMIEKSRAQIQNLQQTISLLVSEKASLTASLDRLEDLESRRYHFPTITCLCDPYFW